MNPMRSSGRVRHLASPLALLTLVVASCAGAQTATENPPATGSNGRIVEAEGNIRNFAPKDSAAATINSLEVDLRKVFEDLGPDATLWYQHVQTLSNPFFEGRAPGTHGEELAAEYIEFYFHMYGLTPALPGMHMDQGGEKTEAWTSFRQPFDFASPNPKASVISAEVSAGSSHLEEGKDFTPLGVSGNGKVTAPLTFVGYGIAEGQDGYTSFDADCDLTERIAVVLRYEPLNEEGKSAWSQTRFSRFASIAPKFKALADRHAAAIILVTPPGAVDAKAELESLKDSARFGARQAIPVVQLSPEAVDRLITNADPQKRTLLQWRELADRGEVTCTDLSDDAKVTISTDLEVDDRLETQNVAGVLRGKGSLADQWIVIGGHYDHLGTGYTGAMPSNIGQLHPGADDNASGTAGVLIATKRLSERYAAAAEDENLRSIIFIGFGAEEAGLFGSKYFVDNSPVPVENITLMMNMDMIGRLRSDNLLVQGTGTAKEFDTLLPSHVESSGLTISASKGGRGPSDHSNFYTAKIPVLFMFTGEHAEYHKPGDQGYTVNPAGAMKVLNLLESIVWDVATRPERLTYAETSGGGDARRTGSRVRFGIQPDYTAQLETGLRVEDVSDGTSAADAGIKAGDILLTWNGEELTGGQKLFEFLSKAEPGDEVKVGLQRGEQEMIVEVTLKPREQTE